MKRISGPAFLVAAAVAVSASGVLAHGGATGVVKERMELMESMGDAVKALAAMFRGKEPYDAERVRRLAGSIEAHGAEAMTKLFPEGSLDHPSEALPAIWKEWPRFEALARDTASYAGALREAAGNPRPPHGQAHGGMTGGAMTGGGMTGGGHGMMHGGGGMQGGPMQGGGMMMGRSGAGPTPEQLAGMPPDAAFMHLAESCGACHQDFRKSK